VVSKGLPQRERALGFEGFFLDSALSMPPWDLRDRCPVKTRVKVWMKANMRRMLMRLNRAA